MNPELTSKKQRKKLKRKGLPASPPCLPPDEVQAESVGFWLVPNKTGFDKFSILKEDIVITEDGISAHKALLNSSLLSECSWLRSELRRAGNTTGLQRAALLKGCAFLIENNGEAYYGGSGAALPTAMFGYTGPTPTQVTISGAVAGLIEDFGDDLNEATLPELQGLTQDNGFYALGGMRRVNGRWVIDPSVRNRTQNSHFVVVNPPRWTAGPDGLPILTYTCRSRPDRNTSGLTQTGFVRVISRESGLRRFGRRVLNIFGMGRGLNPQVQVFCTCADFKYRFHWVLAQAGAAPTPTGVGGQATNQPPNQTNPSRRPSLCKHLSAVSSFVDFDDSELRRILNGNVVTPTGPGLEPVVEPATQFRDT